ncbi:MAG: metal ABC transporter permease [Gammaproteobacteria bacterium]
MDFFSALSDQNFLRYALIAGLLASIGCGVVGTYVVVRNIGYLAGGIAHAVLGGMGIAYFLGQPPLGGAILTALLAALVIGWVSLRWKQTEDSLIGALWAVGMAVGIIFISQTPGYNADLMSYLFGNILLVSKSDLFLMAGLDLVILICVGLFYKQFQAVTFDEEFSRLRGVHAEIYYLLLLCLVALTVVLLIRVVGLILVIALLTLPAAIARQYFGTLFKIMCLSIVIGGTLTLGGLVISYEQDLPSGATIILVAGMVFFVSTIVTKFWRGIIAKRLD